MSRKIDNVNLRTAVHCLPIPIILFYSLALAGSVSNSPGVPELYLAKVGVNGQAQSVQFGYFGMCGVVSGANRMQLCVPSSGQTIDDLNGEIFGTQANDNTKGLIQFCQNLKSKIFLPLLAGAAVLFLLSNITFALHRMSVKKQQRVNRAPTARGQWMKSATMILLLSSWAVCLGAAASVAMATHALSFNASTISSDFQFSPGESLQVLQWLAFAASTLYVLGIVSILRGVHTAQGTQGASVESAIGGGKSAFDF